MMFSKILIANRGEIAVRIMQTCREMGIATVAVYSDVDAGALHVRRADEAYLIGPAAPRESYLNIDAVLEAAQAGGAEAIHPGYGFLAENAAFAEAVLAAGLTWIGPPPAVIALLGDKVAAKAAAERAGVPVVPGYSGSDLSTERLASEAARIGFPVMLKAAGGGGGKGMRAVDDARTLPDSLEAARREAAAAFGDDRIFLEKLLVRPRHIEVQILADDAGHVISLGERDCSVQRRHQKVVEEAPSPAVTPELRASLGESARRVARETGYVNAGTVEFLFDGHGYYFLEVNTRIQVEHPVTEMLTGLDLVRCQIDIAAGEPLPLRQEEIELRGHAIEGRLYAEDPSNHFLPSAGRVTRFRPPQGPGIRTDVGVEAGDEVSSFYDPIMAKLVVHAASRPRAVARFRDALERFAVAGPATNHRFLQWIAAHSDFVGGNADIELVDRMWRPDESAAPQDLALVAAALYTAGSAAAPSSDPWRSTGGWRANGQPRRFEYAYGGKTYVVELEETQRGTWRVSTDGRAVEARLLASTPDRLAFQVGAGIHEATVTDRLEALTVTLAGESYTLRRPSDLAVARSGGPRGEQDAGLSAPMPATVVKVVVSPGQRVGAREPLVILEAMKMEHVVESPHPGTVAAILVREGDMVQANVPLVRLDP